MSPREWQFQVRDILDAIAKIERYTAAMSPSEFEADSRTLDAVVRNFIIIGEAAAHMSPEIVAKYPDIPWRLMGDMRNFAVHEYWGVDASVIWRTIKDDLPALSGTLRKIVDS